MPCSERVVYIRPNDLCYSTLWLVTVTAQVKGDIYRTVGLRYGLYTRKGSGWGDGVTATVCSSRNGNRTNNCQSQSQTPIRRLTCARNSVAQTLAKDAEEQISLSLSYPAGIQNNLLDTRWQLY